MVTFRLPLLLLLQTKKARTMKKNSIKIGKRDQQKLLAASLVSLLLSACGGGSNDIVPTPPPTTPTGTPFTSWSAVTPGSTVVVPGMSQQVSWTGVPTTGPVTSIGTPTAVDTSASSFTETLNNSGAITKIVIASPTGNVTFDTAVGDTIGFLAIDPDVIVAVNGAGTNIALAADPAAFGWNYQSFGVWETGMGTGSGSAGVMSAGAPTAGSAIPISGTATFTGALGGIYVDASGNDFVTEAALTVNADFGARTLGVSSAGTIKSPDLASTSTASNLNLTGTLTYAAGSNAFAGTVTNGSTLTGTSNGRFYGPAAEELGGVFVLKANSGVEAYGGAYGAKR
jgi:hypothetical protein